MDPSMLEEIVFWNWWVFALVLIIVEVLVAGTFFLWMGISAALVGLVLFLFPGLGWEMQLSLFAFFSVISIIISRIWLAKHARAGAAASILGENLPLQNLSSMALADSMWMTLSGVSAVQTWSLVPKSLSTVWMARFCK